MGKRMGFIRVHESDDWDGLDVRVGKDGDAVTVFTLEDPKPGKYELVRKDSENDSKSMVDDE